jgi:DNA repair protein SbcD/Mre11
VLRVLHTSDLHLGHQLHGISRAYEHRVYLDWLVDQLVTLEVDALLVTGDIFDTANPPTQAQALWYGFLGQARRNCPNLDIVVIGGNHDSAQRLDAPKALLHELDITVIGGVPQRKGKIDIEAMVIPLRDRNRKIAAWVAAVPFIRVSDLPKAPPGIEDPIAHGVQEIYSSVLRVARANRRPRQALLATGHFTLTGSKLSDTTERPVLNGAGIPSEAFSSDLAYVALGHLHFAQRVPGPTYLRYAGSPIPLSITERDYDHQVVVIEIEGENVRRVRAIPTPRTVRLERIGPAPLDAVIAALEAYPERGDSRPSAGEASDALLPIVQVAVVLDAPVPDLRGQIEAAAAGKALRLARISIERTAGTGAALAEAYVGGESLVDITPEEVFVRRYARDHEGPPPAKLLETFRELVDGVVTGAFDLDEESADGPSEHTPSAPELEPHLSAQ